MSNKEIIEKIKGLVNPDKFIKWLKAEGSYISGDYQKDVFLMCEYGSLYISMLLSKELYASKLHLTSTTKFTKPHSHYFITLINEGEEYIIDLTLTQFDKTHPKLILSPYKEVYSLYGKTTVIKNIIEHVEDNDAHEYFINPNTMSKPELWFSNL